MAKVSLRAYNRETETMIDRGQLDEAIAHCHHIFKTFPKHLETYRLLGKAYLEYKRYGEAVDIFTRVLVSVPNDFVANVGMSIIRDEENKLDDAIWHMERAFEVQPSNSAIQSELQRLYSRRDGVAPPRIRMTRGALAHMYVQGELYPQAISEIKNVLKEDAGRSDMQALLARAHYRSGQKNEAAEVASALLRRYPYCLDANRVLAEILGAERPDNAKAYRDRVVELDPYASQVNGTLFQSNEVPDQAVMTDHLDWNGQPVAASAQTEWRGAISTGSLGGGRSRDEQPDWLKNAAINNVPTVHPKPETGPAFEPPVTPAQPTPEDQIPDFLRSAGWGQSTGAFDESKPVFAEEEPASGASLAQGDLPDWVKAMAPQQEAQPAAEEELPDWINNIKPGVVAAASATAAQTDDDWMNQLGQPSQPAEQAADEGMDWLKGLETSTPSASTEQPDWLKGLGSETPAQPSEQPDWLKGLGGEPEASTPVSDQLDWLSGLGNEPQTPAQPADQPDWLKGLGEEEPASIQPATELDRLGGLGNEPQTPAQPSEDLDWLKGLGAETPAQATEQPDWLSGLGNESQTPAQPADQPDWLKGLGEEAPSVQPPASEADWLKGLGEETTPSQPAAEPDWLKGLGEETPAASQAGDMDWLKGLGEETPAAPKSEEPDWLQGLGEETPSATPQAEESDWLKQFDVQPRQPEAKPEPDFSFLDEIPAPAAEQPAVPVTTPPAVEPSTLGTSQKDIDDSLAWLESLAAKQGATEGLLVKPEERKSDEPEWVRKIKANMAPPVSEQKTPEPSVPPVAEPEPTPPAPVEQSAPKMEDLGKSQSDIDDSLAWLESLAAKQGATEGLLVKPEERKEEEPEWVRKIKASTAPVSEQKAPEPPVPPVTEPAPEPTPVEQPVARVEDLGTSQSEIDDSLAWLESLAAKQGATEGLLVKPEERKAEEPEWVRRIKASTPPASEQKAPETPVVPAEEIIPEPETPVVEQPVAKVEDLGTSQKEIDDSLAWLESLAAKQGATEGLLTKPEERLEQEPEWVKQAKSASQPPVQSLVEPAPSEPVSAEDDTTAWLKGLEEEKTQPEPETSRVDETAMWLRGLEEEKASTPSESTPAADETAMWLRSLDQAKPSAADETAMWLKSLDEPEATPAVEPVQPAQDDLPAWLQSLDEEKATAAEPAVPEKEAEESAVEFVEEPVAQQEKEESLPSWLSDLEKEEAEAKMPLPTEQEDLPAWLRDQTGEVVAEPTKIEPTRPTDWKPVEPKPEAKPEPKPESKPARKAPAKAEARPATPPEPYKEPVTRIRGTGMLTMPTDPALGSARAELTRSNIPGALEAYGKLIKKGRFLDEVIFDLREALYRYPVEVSIWQSLGDAYMRANRLQDALDAYTKAEELLR